MKHKGIAVAALTLGVMSCLGATNSKMYRAFLMHEKHDDHSPIYSYSNLAGGEDELRRIRFQNSTKQAKHIDLDTAVSVGIEKASDSGNYVISVTDVDGVTSSLWLDGGDNNKNLHVVSVSPY